MLTATYLSSFPQPLFDALGGYCTQFSSSFHCPNMNLDSEGCFVAIPNSKFPIPTIGDVRCALSGITITPLTPVPYLTGSTDTVHKSITLLLEEEKCITKRVEKQSAFRGRDARKIIYLRKASVFVNNALCACRCRCRCKCRRRRRRRRRWRWRYRYRYRCRCENW